jgi:hypothetical protein
MIFHPRIMSKWLAWAEVALVSAVTIVPRILTLGGTFVVNDETLYWDWSNQFVRALLRGDWGATLVGKAYPSVTIMWVQAVGFALRWLWAWLTGALTPQFYYQLALDRPLDFALLAERRLPMALANAAIVILLYLYARQLLGRKVALIAGLLIGLDPFLLSDARTMRGDSLMAGLMVLSVLSLLLASRRQSWRHLVISAVMAGLALLDKMTALPLIALGAALLGGEGAMQAWAVRGAIQHRLRRFWEVGGRALLMWLVVVTLTCVVLWPALWAAPGSVWEGLATQASTSIEGRPTYFMGRYSETDPFPLFYPVNFFFRCTPLTLMGLALLLVAAVEFVRRRRRGETLFTPLTVSLLVLAAYNLLNMGAMTAGVLKRGWYMLPIVPSTLLLAAQGWVWLAERVRRRWPSFADSPAWQPVSWAAVGGMLVIQVVQAVPYHPYYFTYWNPFASGEFVSQLEMLNWGLDTSLAARWLNAQPAPQGLKVAMRPSFREFAPMFKGEIIPFTAAAPWVQADYIVLRERHVQLGEHEPEQLAYLQQSSPVYTLTLNSVAFGWIYRGPDAQIGADSQLAGKATLLGYDLPPLPLRAEQPDPFRIFWDNEGLAADEHLVVRLVDADGFEWAKAPVVPRPGFESASQTKHAVVESQADLRLPVGTPPGLFFLKIGVQKDQGPQWIGDFTLPASYDRITVAKTAMVSAEPPLAHVASQSFGDGLLLLGYNLPETLSSAENTVDLYWQAQRDMQKDYVLALRLLDQAGQEAWYRLARPARGIYPTPGWQAGEVVRDPWSMPSADKVAPGSYTLELEIYEGDTGRSVGKTTLGPVTLVAVAQ